MLGTYIYSILIPAGERLESIILDFDNQSNAIICVDTININFIPPAPSRSQVFGKTLVVSFHSTGMERNK